MYKPFPNDNRIGVSPEGVLFNYRTCKILKQHKTKSGYMNIVLTSPGMKHRAYRVHRIYAITYVKRPMHLQHIPFKQLEVNHKDGNKANNTKTNLEWVTGSGNVIHAVDNKLTPIPIEIQILNINSGEIFTEKSIRRAAEKYGVPLPTLAKHLRGNMAGQYAYCNYAFRHMSIKPWPKISSKKRTWFITMAANKVTGEAHTFETLMDAAKYTKINYTTIHKALITKQKDSWENNEWSIQIT
ncbi:HNH endonuclease [Pseudomonas phage Psa21]|uniref:HNH endonuclease n=1 Tax=Pseudomonas phage Psa21 TaxID=2530023 RepID=A0A481W5B6_9CAUD|nr:HNH endonuclease [Pseudomonas phage Psa21]QBJ02928.1 HNH endonuclease [Pseudomonas phage Psa21]